MVLGRRVDYLSPTLHLTDILIFFLLISWGVDVLRHRRKVAKSFIFGFIGIVIAAFINVRLAVNPMAAFCAWVKVLEFAFLGCYIYTTRPERRRILFLLSWSVLYSSLVAIGQFLLQKSVGGPLWLLGERTFTLDTPGIARADFAGREILRAYGTFPHPNVLGGFLAITLPMILGGIQKRASNMGREFYGLVMTLGVIALILTLSRSAITLFAVVVSWQLWKMKKAFFFLPLLMLITLPYLWTDESFVVRNQLNDAAIQMVLSHPVFGVGLGNFLVELPTYLPTRTIYFLQPVHNIYLLLLSEVGALGVMGIFWILWRIRKHIEFSVALGTIAILGLVDHYFLTLQQGQLLLTIVFTLSLRAKKTKALQV